MNPRFSSLTIVLVLAHFCQAEVDRILCVGIQQTSHISEVVGATEKLSSYGHELYLAISTTFPKPERYEKKGFKVLSYEMPPEDILPASPEFEKLIADVVLSGGPMLEFDRQYSVPFAYRDCEYMMKDKKFIDSVNALNISLIIVDGFILCPCNLILPAYLNIPFVIVSSTFLPFHAKIAALPSFLPSLLSPYSDRMSFMERIKNSLNVYVLMNLPFKETHDTSLLEKYAPQYSSWNDVSEKTLLYMQTRNYVMEWPTPVMPNFIMVPGLSTGSTAENLDSKIRKQVEANPHGIIVMSFGSMFAQLPDHIVIKFMEAFAKLDQSIFWKLRVTPGHTSFKIPSNVHLLNWLPQGELLAHPNVKLFITHCGNGGQHEAVYNGVPMLGFPLFAEQPHNSYRAMDHGIALQMKLLDFTSDELLHNIKRLISEPSFRQEAQKMAAILQDRPMTSQEEAAYWINHVMKHGGDHLRSHTMDMPWWKILMLDIMGVFLIVAILALCVVSLVMRKIYKVTCKQKKEKAQG